MAATREQARQESILQWEQAGISNDFLFGKIMQQPENCKPLLECILGSKIARISYPESQKVMDITYDSHGVRLDVYVEDDQKNAYNIEMQTVSKRDLRKRIRYYGSMLDLSMIEKGVDYLMLKKTIIIFICTFDIFRQGRHIYTFENRCLEDLSLALGDETQKIFLNAAGTLDDTSAELKAFLDYVAGREPADSFTRQIDQAVQYAKSNEQWRLEFMSLHLRDWANRMEARAEGHAEGLAEGRAEGLAKGLAEGRAEGRAEGLAQGRTQVICELLKHFKNAHKTAEVLNIGYEEVLQIASEHHISVTDLQ